MCASKKLYHANIEESYLFIYSFIYLFIYLLLYLTSISDPRLEITPLFNRKVNGFHFDP